MSTLTIKYGDFEFSVEGSDEFVCRTSFDAATLLVEKVGQNLKAINNQSANKESVLEIEDDSVQDLTPVKISGTTKGLALSLKVNGKGSDKARQLIMAAALKFSIDGFEQITMQKFRDEIKTATGFYEKSMNGLLGRHLDQLVAKKQLLEDSTNTYSVPPDVLKELNSKL